MAPNRSKARNKIATPITGPRKRCFYGTREEHSFGNRFIKRNYPGVITL